MDLVIGIRLIVQVCYVYCFLVSFCSLGQQIVLDFAANIKFSIEIAKCTWQKVNIFWGQREFFDAYLVAVGEVFSLFGDMFV